ncbi:MAG: shikimate kinase [Treponema sp.]|jgi:shikimate kinase|nr:shikimate kinase [Treponema sp.]
MGKTEPAQTILLTGPKHTGKSLTGRALAALGWAGFTDLDDYIRERTGKSPRNLYRESPAAFRQAEAAALGSLLRFPGPRIIATGGGLIDNPEAMELVCLSKARQTAILIYLEVPAELAWERIEAAAKASGELPPFLEGSCPRERHRALHERRAAAYRAVADILIPAAGSSAEDLARLIADSLQS